MYFLRALALALAIASQPLQAALELVVTLPVETSLSRHGAADTLKTWLQMIDAAKDKNDSIDIEQFYVSTEKGQAMEKVIAALKAASKRGVPIRVIVDKTFLVRESGGTRVFAGTDIDVRVLDYNTIRTGVQHSKFFIVNDEAYLGSANFDWRALQHIHETGVRTDDAHVVASLRKVFETDWARAESLSDRNLKRAKAVAVKVPASNDVQFVISPSTDALGMKPTFKELLTLIKNAKTSVQIQTMEYTTEVRGKPSETWKQLENALIAAAKKVSVQLLVDHTKRSMPGLSALTRGGVEVRSVEIPQYSKGKIDFARLIHSKYAVMDGESFWVGTDNLAKGYFFESRGVGVVSSDSKVAGQLQAIFEQLWDSKYAHSEN